MKNFKGNLKWASSCHLLKVFNKLSKFKGRSRLSKGIWQTLVRRACVCIWNCLLHTPKLLSFSFNLRMISMQMHCITKQKTNLLFHYDCYSPLKAFSVYFYFFVCLMLFFVLLLVQEYFQSEILGGPDKVLIEIKNHNFG